MIHDSTRFTTLFQEHFSGLSGFLAGLLGDETMGEDLAQEVFARLLRVGMDALGIGEERYWIYRVGRNLALNELKRRRSRGWFLGGLSRRRGSRLVGRWDRLEHREEFERLCRLLDALPPIRRAVLLLREEVGLSYREIGVVLGLPESGVKSHLFRARKSLVESWPEPFGRGDRSLPAKSGEL